MNTTIRSPNVKLTDALRAHIDKKIKRFTEKIPEITQTTLSCDKEGYEYQVQITIATPSGTHRVQHKDKDLYAAIDGGFSRLRQIARPKTRGR